MQKQENRLVASMWFLTPPQKPEHATYWQITRFISSHENEKWAEKKVENSFEKLKKISRLSVLIHAIIFWSVALFFVHSFGFKFKVYSYTGLVFIGHHTIDRIWCEKTKVYLFTVKWILCRFFLVCIWRCSIVASNQRWR